MQLGSVRTVLTLLFVDDSANERLLVREAISLTKTPFNFCQADGLESSIPFFTNHQPWPSVVLLDYDLGTHTGADFLHWLRVTKKITSVPVVMFTSSLGQRNVAQCYANGANHFLRKPNNLSRLKEIIGCLYLSVLHKTPEPIVSLSEYLADPTASCTAGPQVSK